MKNITPREQRQNKAKWQRISWLSWELAKEACIQSKKDPYDYIWEQVDEYVKKGYNTYEVGVMGEWACDKAYALINGEKAEEPTSPNEKPDEE